MSIRISNLKSQTLLPLPKNGFVLSDTKKINPSRAERNNTSCTYTINEQNKLSNGGEGGVDAGFNSREHVQATLKGIGKLKLRVGRQVLTKKSLSNQLISRITVGDDSNYVKNIGSEQEQAIHKMLYNNEFKIKGYCDDREAIPEQTKLIKPASKKNCLFDVICTPW